MATTPRIMITAVARRLTQNTTETLIVGDSSEGLSVSYHNSVLISLRTKHDKVQVFFERTGTVGNNYPAYERAARVAVDKAINAAVRDIFGFDTK